MRRILFTLLATSLTMISCIDKEGLGNRLDELEDRIAAIENAVAATNDNAIAVNRMLKDSTVIVGFKETETGYILELNTDTITVHNGLEVPGIVPMIGIDEDGDWVYSIDNGETFNKIEGAENTSVENQDIPIIRNGKDGYWEISADNGKTWSYILGSDGKKVPSVGGNEEVSAKTIFDSISYDEETETFTFTLKPNGKTVTLPIIKSFSFTLLDYEEYDKVTAGESKEYKVEMIGVDEVAIKTPEGWEATLSDNELTVIAPETPCTGTITIILVSKQGFVRVMNYKFCAIGLDETACDEWNDFILGSSDNHLLDFSYAGYMRGETAPGDFSRSYTTYNIKDYYEENRTDREAFIAALTDALGEPEKTGGSITFPHLPEANAIIYFPEGEYVLHTSADDVENGAKSVSIIVRSGNIVFKGDGAEKTKIIMQDPMQPNNENLYSSPVMLEIKHNSGLQAQTDITGNATKGEYKVSVGNSNALSEDEWVCLYLEKNLNVANEELAPYTPDASWDIVKNGVEVIEYHQIKSINGNEVTFYEPIMHDVKSSWNWQIMAYPNYANVGVEDLTFKGNATEDFIHHKDWNHDGGYKPLRFNRLTNSWIRRVKFESTSEACTIANSANVSAYSIELTGSRGHAAIRAQASTRVLIAGTTDLTSDKSGLKGNFHGVGVSEHSIGTVIWRNAWGDDSCFESHCKQPRATLIDCCSGGWNGTSQGGDKVFAPHHLADLTIWNFEASKTPGGEFKWWTDELKVLPPIVVGFQSADGMTFDPNQTKVISNHGVKVSPESLYEAQLRHRLGNLPLWLHNIKY